MVLLREEILDILACEPLDVVRVHNMFEEMNEVDIADLFEQLNRERTIGLFRLLPKSMAADVFAYLDTEQQQIIIEALSDSEVWRIMDELFVDDAVDFIEEMPANVVTRVLRNAPYEKRHTINQILQYPEDSVGSVMTTEFVELKENISVRAAFDIIRRTGVDKETIYTCYVITSDRLLVGVVSAKDLMLSSPDDRIEDIMDTGLVSAHTTDDREVIADLFRKYDLLAIPVVDNENRLVGIVTVDDAVQVIEEEATEDFEKMAAINPSETPYLKTAVLKLATNRIVWLLVLMLSATLTGGVIASFEDSLAIAPALVAFIPMLMDTGGNCGAQSATLIIRGMALDEIRTRDIFRVLWREIRVGFFCGLVLSLINFIRIYLMNGKNILLSTTVTLSLFATVLLAKSVGCLLPIAAKSLKIDPAIMAAPLITTIVDTVSLTLFFSIAKLVLQI